MKTVCCVPSFLSVCMAFAFALLINVCSASTSAISSQDPFAWGWNDAYDYSHKWGYYRGYNDGAQKGDNNKAGLSASTVINRAPPPRPRPNKASNSFYKKGWELAHEAAAKRGYQKGYKEAKAGQAYKNKLPSSSERPPPPSINDDYHAGWRAVYYRSYDAGYQAAQTDTTSSSSLVPIPPPPQIPPGCNTPQFAKGWNQAHETAWKKGYDAAARQKSSPKTGKKIKNSMQFELGSSVVIGTTVANKMLKPKQQQQQQQPREIAALPEPTTTKLLLPMTTNTTVLPVQQSKTSRAVSAAALGFFLMFLVDVLFWTWSSSQGDLFFLWRSC